MEQIELHRPVLGAEITTSGGDDIVFISLAVRGRRTTGKPAYGYGTLYYVMLSMYFPVEYAGSSDVKLLRLYRKQKEPGCYI